MFKNKKAWILSFFSVVIIVTTIVLLNLFVLTPKIRCVGVDDETCKLSIIKVKQSVGKKKKKLFEESLAVVSMRGVMLDLSNPERMKREMTENIHGLSGRQILSKAREIYQSKLSDLKEKRTSFEQASKEMAKFIVKESSFYFEEGYIGKDPIVSIKVENNTNQTISSAYFDAKVISEGRDVPWLESPFSYKIDGGIKQGESPKWNLDMNRYSDWGNIPDRKDLKLVLKVTRLDGVDGKALWNADFTKENSEQIKDLELKLKEF